MIKMLAKMITMIIKMMMRRKIGARLLPQQVLPESLNCKLEKVGSVDILIQLLLFIIVIDNSSLWHHKLGHLIFLIFIFITLLFLCWAKYTNS